MKMVHLLEHCKGTLVDIAFLNYARHWETLEAFYNDQPDLAALFAYQYAWLVIKRRWQPGERYILYNVHYTFNYIMNVLTRRTRWVAGEEKLLQNVDYAYAYVEQRLKHRWPELEPVLLRYPGYAALYAMQVLKCRWHDAEPRIQEKSLYHWKLYCKHFNIDE